MLEHGGHTARGHDKVQDGVTGVAVYIDGVEEDVTVTCKEPGTLSSQTKQKAPEKPDQTQTTTKPHQHPTKILPYTV